MEDFYQILGVEENADSTTIKRKYRELSKIYHPDKNPQGEDMFKKISNAYEVLSDENKRRDYDFKRKNPFAGQGGSGGFDPFMEFFRNQSRPQAPPRPQQQMNISVGVIDAYLGNEIDMNYARNVMCGSCSGSGGEKKPCSNCGASGFIVREVGSSFFRQRVQQPCPVCQGMGSQLVNACFDCGGSAVKRDMTNFRIKLPNQVSEGQKIRMTDAGDYNPQFNMYNELIGSITLVPQNNFKLEGRNLVFTKEININEAKNDPHIIIPHPDGEMKIRIPNNGSTKTPLRIRGKGYDPNSSDLFVKLEFFLNDLIN